MAAKVQEEKLIRDVHELLVTVEARVLPSELDRLLWLVRDQGYDLDIALQGMMLKRGDFNQIDLIHVALLSPGIMLMKPLDQAAWLINMKQFDVVPVADALHISTHAARIAAGATVAQPSVVETLPSAQPQPAFAPTHVAPQPTAHIGRPRTLHEDSEAELRKRIEDADKSGRPLTKNECLSIANEIYRSQIEDDRAAGLLNPEKEIEMTTNPPHLSASFIGTFLHRNPDLHTRAAHSASPPIPTH